MLKAIGVRVDGGKLIALGLSHKNLEVIKTDKPILVRGTEIGIPEIDILLFSGPTERDMMTAMQKLIGPETEVKIDPKLKEH